MNECVLLWIPVVSISIPSFLRIVCNVYTNIIFMLGGFSWIAGHAFTKTPNAYDFIAASPKLELSWISTTQLVFLFNCFHLNTNKIKQRFMDAGKRLYLWHHQHQHQHHHKQKGDGATPAMVSVGYQKMEVRDKALRCIVAIILLAVSACFYFPFRLAAWHCLTRGYFICWLPWY